MIPFYEYIRSYKGTDADRRAFCKRFESDELFPRGRNLMNDYFFWSELYEQYLAAAFCSKKEIESFRRLFTSYRKENTDKDCPVSLTEADCGGYDSCFSKKMELFAYIDDDRLPVKRRNFYKKLRIVYDEFASLYVLPSVDCNADDLGQFVSWWLKTNLVRNIDNLEPERTRSLSSDDISSAMEKCTSVYIPSEDVESRMDGFGLYKVGMIDDKKVYMFDDDLPLFRRAFIREPSKKGDRSRWQ